MAAITVLVCDECASQEGVKHYEVREDGRKGVMDLCDTHSKALEELLTKGAKPLPRARANRSRTRKVTSMEEIEALKVK